MQFTLLGTEFSRWTMYLYKTRLVGDLERYLLTEALLAAPVLINGRVHLIVTTVQYNNTRHVG